MMLIRMHCRVLPHFMSIVAGCLLWYHWRMKKILCGLFLAFISFFPVSAQQAGLEINLPANQALPPQLYQPELYAMAVIEEITKEGEEDVAGVKQKFQEVKVRISSGKEHGKIVVVKHGGQVSVSENQL